MPTQTLLTIDDFELLSDEEAHYKELAGVYSEHEIR